MKWDTWKRLIVTGSALAGLLLFAAAAPAAVLPDDEEAVAEDQATVKVKEIFAGGETAVKVKVIGDEDGEHMIHWVGSPARRGFLGGNEDVNLVLDVGALLNRSTEAREDTTTF